MLSAKKANRRYFRQAYLTGRHGWEAEQPSIYAVRMLRRLGRIVPGGRLLDVGCGEGRHAIAAAQLGFKVAGIDFEPLAVKRARRLARAAGAGPISFGQANVFDLPFGAARFDVVLDYGCLHHQRKADWPAYVAAVLRVLKPGGYYVLSVFSRRFWMFRGRRRQWHVAQGAYRRCFTARDIAALFGRDFEILQLTEERSGPRGFWHALMKRRT